MVEQSPATVPGSSGEAAGAHRTDARSPDGTGCPADLSGAAPRPSAASDPTPDPGHPRTATGSAHPPVESGPAAASSIATLSRRLWGAVTHLVHARVWPGPWAGDEPTATHSVDSSSRGLGRIEVLVPARRRPARLSARDLPPAALRSDVWTGSLSQPARPLQEGSSGLRPAASGARRIRLRRRGPDDYAMWEATGIVGACLLLAGRPGPLLVRQLEPSALPASGAAPAPGRSTGAMAPRIAKAPPGLPDEPREQERRRSPRGPRLGARLPVRWPKGLRRREVRGLRWAAALGYDIVPATASLGTGSAIPGDAGHGHGGPSEHPGTGEIDLCLVRATALPESTLTIQGLHTLLCDAAQGLRVGGLVLATLRLTPDRHHGFGAAELRGLVARLDDAGLILVGNPDSRDHHALGQVGPETRASSSDSQDRIGASPVVVRLLLRHRGARVA